MKHITVAIIMIIGLTVFTYEGFGFFDQILKPQPKKQETQQEKSQGEQQEQPGLLDALGAFGVKKKDVDLLKKGVGVVQALQPIGEEEEITMGEAVAVEAFARFGGEYRDERLTRYINLVGKTIADVSDRPNLKFHFAILNSQDQNAFAAPGGYIFVTIGLLKTLKNEAELAGVLAHEIAHITQKHMLETIRRGALLSNVSEVTMAAMNKDPKMFSNVIDEITDKLFTKGMDKDKEYEADVYGVEFAYRAGYHPGGLRDYLKTLQGQEGHANSRFFTTHPSTGTRISKIEGLLGQYGDGMSFPVLTKRFQSYMGA
ncbi:M48 family metalloprotease [Candidatus Nitronereus thalassa]|uniref:M48 family metalloprotease n=1 Tax=Candidatus Nitronereus thalassa TaxID=3020898 RepID=A0ABU3K7F5_9BACT|nr:M48 family metalloprotease [Candidatus Nitronereus thalassa]MDT7042283.1 M48 family metalloprotease [Candidatus Nitronereus thalassa]